ncbi:glycosyl transferase group 1 [Microbacterium laevaniformans OR221]|nr:glycosyl transferase group 1 [Microbacterium laevaniformans OR221]
MTGLVVHEWIERTGGSEYVLEKICETLQPSSVLCAWNNDTERFSRWTVRESWISRTPLRGRKSIAIPALMHQWNTRDTSDAEWVLTSSHAFAHHVPVSRGSGTRKLGYIYTPARYVWFPETDRRGQSAAARIVSKPIQVADRARAQELTQVAAISRHIADRVKSAWHLDSDVIYPPVDVARFASAPILSMEEEEQLKSLPGEFILGASRFIPYKRLDVAIRVGELTGLPVVLAGGGPEELRLRNEAEASDAEVHFVVSPSNAVLSALYHRARVLSFAAFEDFGIVPIEAMASGTPVIGLSTGGVSETVVDGLTGALVEDFTKKSLLRAFEKAEEVDKKDCVARAAFFSEDIFASNIREWVKPR